MRRGSLGSDAEQTLAAAVLALRSREGSLAAAILTSIRSELPELEMVEEPGVEEVIRLETATLVHQLVTSLGDPTHELEPPESRHIARLAARLGTPLEEVLSSYRTGHRILEGMLIDAVASVSAEPAQVAAALRLGCRRLFLRMEALQALVRSEYRRELAGLRRSAAAAELRAVQSVIDGSSDHSLSTYELERRHLAVAISGEGAREASIAIARSARRRCLRVEPDEHLVWAWIPDGDAVAVAKALAAPEHPIHAGIGELAPGASGFGRSHREARMALRVAERTGERARRFTDVATEALALADEEAAQALVARQLGNLALDSPRNQRIRATLRAYHSCHQNARSTAAMLGVSDRTVSLRLRQAEEILPHGSSPIALETSLALRILPLLGDTRRVLGAA